MENEFGSILSLSNVNYVYYEKFLFPFFSMIELIHESISARASFFLFCWKSFATALVSVLLVDLFK